MQNDPTITYYVLGYRQAEAGKRMNTKGVPYNFKLSFVCGWLDYQKFSR